MTSARLPIEANEETPRPRSAARSISARPSAPLWVTKPTLPAGRGFARGEGGVEARALGGVEDAEAVGPDQPHPGAAADLDQLALKLDPLPADLGEAGGDHPSARAPPSRRIRAPRRGPTGRGRRSPRGPPRRAPRRRRDRRAPTARRRLPGSTGWTTPSNPDSSRLWKISPPTVPRRREAPITAIERRLRETSSTAAGCRDLPRGARSARASAENAVGSST